MLVQSSGCTMGKRMQQHPPAEPDMTSAQGQFVRAACTYQQGGQAGGSHILQDSRMATPGPLQEAERLGLAAPKQVAQPLLAAGSTAARQLVAALLLCTKRASVVATSNAAASCCCRMRVLAAQVVLLLTHVVQLPHLGWDPQLLEQALGLTGSRHRGSRG